MVGEETAHQRAGHRRDPKHRAQDALVPAAMPKRSNLSGQCADGDADYASANALQRTAHHQHGH